MTAIASGMKAPPFDLPGTDGRNHSLGGLATAKAVIVVFTCNHCPYAKAWEDRLLVVARDYAPRGVSMVAISSNDPVKFPEDGFDEMKKRAKSKKFSIPYLFDESQAVARTYGAQRTPEVFLFDSALKLRYHGMVDDSQEEAQVKHSYLRQALDAILAGREPTVVDTQPVGCTIKWK